MTCQCSESKRAGLQGWVMKLHLKKIEAGWKLLSTAPLLKQPLLARLIMIKYPPIGFGVAPGGMAHAGWRTNAPPDAVGCRLRVSRKSGLASEPPGFFFDHLSGTRKGSKAG